MKPATVYSQRIRCSPDEWVLKLVACAISVPKPLGLCGIRHLEADQKAARYPLLCHGMDGPAMSPG
jgi:hypothetical protein